MLLLLHASFPPTLDLEALYRFMSQTQVLTRRFQRKRLERISRKDCRCTILTWRIQALHGWGFREAEEQRKEPFWLKTTAGVGHSKKKYQVVQAQHLRVASSKFITNLHVVRSWWWTTMYLWRKESFERLSKYQHNTTCYVTANQCFGIFAVIALRAHSQSWCHDSRHTQTHACTIWMALWIDGSDMLSSTWPLAVNKENTWQSESNPTILPQPFTNPIIPPHYLNLLTVPPQSL